GNQVAANDDADNTTTNSLLEYDGEFTYRENLNPARESRMGLGVHRPEYRLRRVREPGGGMESPWARRAAAPGAARVSILPNAGRGQLARQAHKAAVERNLRAAECKVA